MVLRKITVNEYIKYAKQRGCAMLVKKIKNKNGNKNDVIFAAWEKGARAVYPYAKKLSEKGVRVSALLGFSDCSEIEMEHEFAAVSNRLFIMTKNGSAEAKCCLCGAFCEMNEEVSAAGEIYLACPEKMLAELLKTLKGYEEAEYEI